jgi:hypothetical protein
VRKREESVARSAAAAALRLLDAALGAEAGERDESDAFLREALREAERAVSGLAEIDAELATDFLRAFAIASGDGFLAPERAITLLDGHVALCGRAGLSQHVPEMALAAAEAKISMGDARGAAASAAAAAESDPDGTIRMPRAGIVAGFLIADGRGEDALAILRRAILSMPESFPETIEEIEDRITLSCRMADAAAIAGRHTEEEDHLAYAEALCEKAPAIAGTRLACAPLLLSCRADHEERRGRDEAAAAWRRALFFLLDAKRGETESQSNREEERVRLAWSVAGKLAEASDGTERNEWLVRKERLRIRMLALANLHLKTAFPPKRTN